MYKTNYIIFLFFSAVQSFYRKHPHLMSTIESYDDDANNNNNNTLISITNNGELIKYPILHRVYDNRELTIISWYLNCSTIPKNLLFAVYLG